MVNLFGGGLWCALIVGRLESGPLEGVLESP